MTDMNMPLASKDRREAGAKSVHLVTERSRPEWAQGLRRIYDTVLSEPLPDSVRALLARLDEGAPN